MSKTEHRPLLKGYLHLFSLIFYTIFFFKNVGNNSSIFDAYLFIVIIHFATSSLLHLYPWKDYLLIVRRIDHISIFLVIWFAYQVFIAHLAPEFSSVSKIILNTGTLIGIVSRIFNTDSDPKKIAIPYIIVGWSALTDISSLYLVVEKSFPCFLMILMSGISFTTGAFIYMNRIEINCIKNYIGFHEFFHIFTITGTSFYTKALYDYIHGLS